VWTFPVPVLEVIDLNVALMKDNKNQGFSDLINPFHINGKTISYNTLLTQKNYRLRWIDSCLIHQ